MKWVLTTDRLPTAEGIYWGLWGKAIVPFCYVTSDWDVSRWRSVYEHYGRLYGNVYYCAPDAWWPEPLVAPELPSQEAQSTEATRAEEAPQSEEQDNHG